MASVDDFILTHHILPEISPWRASFFFSLEVMLSFKIQVS